ncbi:MAG: glycolate oxidase subunit GlcE [Acidiferrobacterales bacterium]
MGDNRQDVSLNGTHDCSEELRDLVRTASNAGKPLQIAGGGSKSFYGRDARGTCLAVHLHRGIVSYDPCELVLTARAGTPLKQIEAVLAKNNQMLAFEPPHLGEWATLGGAIATGLSGPRRPYAGAARDFVLGVKLINGHGEILKFGGQVMKNVAGYDVARLMVGALGTLGVLLEISLKVLPRPATELTLVQHRSPGEAIEVMNIWARRSLPLSGCCYGGDRLYVRLCGADSAVSAAHGKIGGEILANAPNFWLGLREQRHAFFDGPTPLWRVAVPPAQPPLGLPGKWLIDWGGAQRWLKCDTDAATIRRTAAECGGHAMLFRGGDRSGEIFHPLTPELFGLHQRIKNAMDPKHIFNLGRMYSDL